MTSVVCYLFGGNREFHPDFVGALRLAFKAHLRAPHRFICVTDRPAAEFHPEVEVEIMPPAARALIDIPAPGGRSFPSSFPRLWTFSEEARCLGERVLVLDIDCMIVGDPRRLFLPAGDFVGWRRPAYGPQPRRFGGGTWLVRPGARAWVWEEFIRDPASAIARAQAALYPGSDQGWISCCLSETEPEFPQGHGIYAAQEWRKVWNRQLRVRERRLRRGQRPTYVEPLHAPADAVILHMNGQQKPWQIDDVVTARHFWPWLKLIRKGKKEARAC